MAGPTQPQRALDRPVDAGTRLHRSQSHLGCRRGVIGPQGGCQSGIGPTGFEVEPGHCGRAPTPGIQGIRQPARQVSPSGRAGPGRGRGHRQPVPALDYDAGCDQALDLGQQLSLVGGERQRQWIETDGFRRQIEQFEKFVAQDGDLKRGGRAMAEDSPPFERVFDASPGNIDL